MVKGPNRVNFRLSQLKQIRNKTYDLNNFLWAILLIGCALATALVFLLPASSASAQDEGPPTELPEYAASPAALMKVLLLVCAADTGRVNCDENTAHLVLNGPDAPNEIACAMQSQAYFANTALGIGEGEYLKINCIHRKADSARID